MPYYRDLRLRLLSSVSGYPAAGQTATISSPIRCAAIRRFAQQHPENVRVYAYQMSIKCGVMDLRKRDAVRNDQLAETFVLIRNDMRRI